MKDRLAVQRNSHLHEKIMETGFDKKVNVLIVTAKRQAIKMLYHGRAEYIVGNKLMLHARIKELGLDPTLIEPIEPVDTSESILSIAFSQQTSDETVQKVIDAVNRLKADGRYGELLKKWQLD